MKAMHAIVATLLIASFLPFVPSAAAQHTCATAFSFGASAAGSVSSSAPSDFWRHSTTLGRQTYELHPFGGDADLYVYNLNCSQQLCSSAAGGNTVDRCTAQNPGGALDTNPQTVEVRYWFDSDGVVEYILTATFP